MNILSFDIEEPWHTLPRSLDYEKSCRPFDIEAFLDSLIPLLDCQKITPIFFWVGTVAERHKKLVRKLADMNFLVASHGYDHEDFSQLYGNRLTQALSR